MDRQQTRYLLFAELEPSAPSVRISLPAGRPAVRLRTIDRQQRDSAGL